MLTKGILSAADFHDAAHARALLQAVINLYPLLLAAVGLLRTLFTLFINRLQLECSKPSGIDPNRKKHSARARVRHPALGKDMKVGNLSRTTYPAGLK